MSGEHDVSFLDVSVLLACFGGDTEYMGVNISTKTCIFIKSSIMFSLDSLCTEIDCE